MKAQMLALLQGRPLLPVKAADFSLNTLTLGLAANLPVPRGRVAVLSEAEAEWLHESLQRAELFVPPSGPVCVDWHYLDDRSFQVRRGNGYEAIIYFRRAPGGKHQPQGFWGSEERVDERGVRWHHRLPTMVMDDFGSLVPVDGGAL